MTPPELTVAHELAEIRRTVEVGFTRVDGQLALLVQRGEQTDKMLDDHEQRLDALERSRWPVQAVTALTAVGALGLAVWQALGR
ncbi:hypothetical protein ACIQNG_25725 [Streptomyces sp. NPDC091377]|uniref:hypothetical protein n=1 Tax=Streptomyces sp. NPDC091377 TaxID=3365995 RepID=UPI00380E3E77